MMHLMYSSEGSESLCRLYERALLPLQKQATGGTSEPARAAAVDALAMLTFVSNENLDAADSVLAGLLTLGGQTGGSPLALQRNFEPHMCRTFDAFASTGKILYMRDMIKIFCWEVLIIPSFSRAQMITGFQGLGYVSIHNVVNRLRVSVAVRQGFACIKDFQNEYYHFHSLVFNPRIPEGCDGRAARVDAAADGAAAVAPRRRLLRGGAGAPVQGPGCSGHQSECSGWGGNHAAVHELRLRRHPVRYPN